MSLAFIAGEHDRAGLIEYERGIAVAESKADRWRRHGLLAIALADLAEGIDDEVATSDPETNEAACALSALEKALADVPSPATAPA